MRWADWEPIYQEILADFGYDRKADEDARDLLAKLAANLPRPTVALDGEITIAGPHRAALPPDARVLATDAASWAFPRAIAIVTDLDGDVQAQIDAEVPLYVHAHGDNMPALERWVPRMRGPVQPTTQAEPVSGVANHGGFTDGDRAACIAVALGAQRLLLAGFDWHAPAAKPGRDPDVKRRKLAWGRRIVERLGVPVRYV